PETASVAGDLCLLFLEASAQLGEIGEPLTNLTLETALGRIVELLALHPVREVVLAGESFWRIVIVLVDCPVAFLSHQPSRSVQNVLRRTEAAALLGGTHSAFVGNVSGIRFRGYGEINGRLRQNQLALRAAEEVVHILGRECL